MNFPKAITANHIDVVQLVVIYSLSQLLSESELKPMSIRSQLRNTTTDRAICPGFGTGIRLPGQKLWRLLSRLVEPGQNVPHAKKYLCHAGLEPKTYCLAHGFLANSTK